MKQLVLLPAIFFSAFVAHSVHAIAYPSVFPIDGYASMTLELLMQPPQVSGAAQAFEMSMKGTVDSTYPLRVEKAVLEGTIRYLYTDGKVAAITDSGSCNVTNDAATSDDVVLWDAIRTMLLEVIPYFSGRVTYYRGFETVVVSQMLNLTIPVAYGGGGTSSAYSVSYYLLRPWHVNYMPMSNAPAGIVIQNADKPLLSLTFFEFGKSTVSLTEFEFPLQCEGKTSLVNKAQSKEVAMETTMPSFPDEFSAKIQVLMPTEKTTFTMHEQFSAKSRLSRSTVYGALPDEVGRVKTYDWYILGSYQMSYFREQSRVPDGHELSIPEDVRQYFWPDTDTCMRVQMGFDAIAGTVGALMLYSPDVPPVYIGLQTVRGVLCKVWSASVSGVRVRWFWADHDEATFVGYADNTKAPTKLMRIVVEGSGTAPFYAHHPFLAQGAAFPLEYRRGACFRLNRWDPACYKENEHFKYIYDITSFTAHLSPDALEVPKVCARGDAPVSAIPDVECRSSDGASLVLFLLITALVSAFAGGCIIWCRFAPMVRNLQREVTELATEIARGETQTQQPQE